MNHCYKLVFNRSLNLWQAVSELARSRGKSARATVRSVMIIVALTGAAAVQAQSVTTSDDLTDGAGSGLSPGVQPNPWNTATILNIGRVDIGTMDVANGGEVLSDGAELGFFAGSNGGVFVHGVDGLGNASKWTMTGDLHVGWQGTGTLTIAGGNVSNDWGIVGSSTSATGTVTVRGANSTWTNAGELHIGVAGAGTLIIQNAGSVTADYAGIGDNANASGSVLIEGTGSRWTLASDLAVAPNGIGTLIVQAGGNVSSGRNGYIGVSTSSTGSVTVQGAGSAWTNTGELRIGLAGTGLLTVQGGANVSNTNGIVGGIEEGNGSVTVRDALSTWANTGPLYVGFGGKGALVIENGGTVANTTGYIGNDVGSTGKVTIDDANSRWTNNLDLYAGVSGTGELLVSNGGAVSNSAAYLGYNADSNGAVAVRDAGSTWTNASIVYVGYNGSGTLDITNGGSVTSATSYIGRFAGSVGTVIVDGSGSSWTMNGSSLIVGDAGTGQLSITDGGSVSSDFSYIGDGVDSDGTVIIDGADSTWEDANQILIGGNGTGALRLSNGATVTAPTMLVSAISASSGTGLLAVGSGNGKVDGNVRVNASGTLAGQSDSTLTISGNLLLDPASTVSVTLGAPSTTALFDVGNNLTLDGTLNIDSAASFGAGLYRLFNYSAALDDRGLDIGSTPNGYTADDLQVQTAVDNQVNLIVLEDSPLPPPPPAPTGPFVFWDGVNTAANGRADGGAGTWSASGTNWTNTSASGNGAYDADGLLIFAGIGGIVNVEAGGAGSLPIGAGLQFANEDYRVQGDALALSGATTTIRVGDGTTAGAGYTATIAANIIGAGGIDKTDLGTLILTGANTYSGDTRIRNGALVMRGSAINSVVMVDGGARLSGNGVIGALVVNSGGVAAPGESIGTLNVDGAVTFNGGSFFEVEANAAGNADAIHATGVATLDGGTVSVLAGSGNYAPATTYTILTADAGVTGEFGNVTSNLAFLMPSLGYDANTVTLTMTRNDVSFPDIGGTFNQRATGAGVESLGMGNAIWDAVIQMNEVDAQDAFDQVSGELHASAVGALIEDSRFVRDAVTSRLWEADCGGSVGDARCGDDNGGNGTLWVRGIGSWGSADGDGNAAKFGRSLGGFFLGGDGAATNNTRVGVFFGFDHSAFDVRARNAAGDSRDYHLGAYTGSQWAATGGAVALRLSAAYSFHQINTARTVAFEGFTDRLLADYSAGTAQVFGELGRSFLIGSSGSIEPFIDAAYVNVHSGSFAEQGGAAALSAQGENTDGVFSTVGLHWATRFGTSDARLTATGTVGWRHAFGDAQPAARLAMSGGDAFTVAGMALAGNVAVIDAGLRFATSKNVTLGVSYNGQFGSDRKDNGVRAQFNLVF